MAGGVSGRAPPSEQGRPSPFCPAPGRLARRTDRPRGRGGGGGGGRAGAWGDAAPGGPGRGPGVWQPARLGRLSLAPPAAEQRQVASPSPGAGRPPRPRAGRGARGSGGRGERETLPSLPPSHPQTSRCPRFPSPARDRLPLPCSPPASRCLKLLLYTWAFAFKDFRRRAWGLGVIFCRGGGWSGKRLFLCE